MTSPITQSRDVQHATGKCALTGRELKEGEEFHTALFEQGESFVRADYSVEAWTGPPPGAYCHFRSRIPVKEKRRKLFVDNQVLIGFFERLAGESEPVRLHFRFVLALILMRKRLLRYEGSAAQDGTEVWTMTLMHDQSKHRVVNPQLTDEQIEGVSRELGGILHSDMGEWTAPAGEVDAEKTGGTKGSPNP